MALDTQLYPNLLPPQKCPNGCARWAQLASDGNTQNQDKVNSLWVNGTVPDDAGNKCAQPPGFPGVGPWCYCAGTNDNSWGYCQDKDNKASICKSKPDGLNNLYNQITECTNNTEHKRIQDFAQNTQHLQQNIESMRMVVQDSLVLGDAMFGATGHVDITSEVKTRNNELKEKKEKLEEDIRKKEAIVERSNRDFTYVRESLPETLPTKTLHFIEDYTVAILMISYLFMAVAGIYVYTSYSEHWVRGLLVSTIGSITLSICLFVLFYLMA